MRTLRLDAMFWHCGEISHWYKECPHHGIIEQLAHSDQSHRVVAPSARGGTLSSSVCHSTTQSRFGHVQICSSSSSLQIIVQVIAVDMCIVRSCFGSETWGGLLTFGAVLLIYFGWTGLPIVFRRQFYWCIYILYYWWDESRCHHDLRNRVVTMNWREGELKPMDAEQLREYGHKMVDFIADYYNNIENFPVLSQVQPGYLRKLLPETAPAHSETLQDVLEDVQTKILPGVTHWQSPDYFAYFPSNSSVAGFLGEMLSAGINMVGFSWITSPAATELEMIVLDWLAKALKLPDEFLSTGQGGGVIQGTASEAVLVVLLAARDKVLRRVGKDAISKLVVYCSDQTHSSLQKACQIGGIHLENFRVLKANSSRDYALSPDALLEAISHDVATGFVPFFFCATIGTTSSTAVDPLLELGKIAKSNSIWFHVDAAYAGSACICPEYRGYINGVEEADSFNMNAHKWFLTNFDCSALWVKDRSALIQSLSTNPEYLKNKASQGNLVVDYKDWQVPLGRRFRSLKLWMVLRLYGLEKLQAYIRNHIELAKLFEELVAQDKRFEIVTPRKFSLVCFRLVPPPSNEDYANKLNHDLLDSVNSTGKLFISHTFLSDRYILRFAVGAPLTEERHIVGAWKVLQDEAATLLSKC